MPELFWRGTRRIGTDENKAMTWSYQSDAFGVGTPSGTASVRLRLPGQIDLGVLGISYNYFRDYDPQAGRYVESDPIGIEGGLNTYGYVDQNPLTRSDPTGEFWNIVAGAGSDLAWQLLVDEKSWDCIDWTSVAISGVTGGAVGRLFRAGGFATRGWQAFNKTGWNSSRPTYRWLKIPRVLRI
ncbi:MAG: hypothetical protein BroJett010_25570 [Gammaproteobacteria bacterium]|nr:MAG: hypothetical protein BroJett010_25570 [Gammaproteobacteria bacterium]